MKKAIQLLPSESWVEWETHGCATIEQGIIDTQTECYGSHACLLQGLGERGRLKTFEGFTEGGDILAFVHEQNFDENMKTSQKEGATQTQTQKYRIARRVQETLNTCQN